MVLDIIFLAVLILAVYTGKKRGFVSVLLSMVSTLLSVMIALSFRDLAIKELEKTQIYKNILEDITVKLSDKITADGGKIFALISENGIERVATSILSVIITIAIFLLAFLVVKVLSLIIKGIFKLPVLNLLNGTLGMIWSAVTVIILTYFLLILAQGFLSEDSFILLQIESSYVLKFMMENNLLYLMLSKGDKV